MQTPAFQWSPQLALRLAWCIAAIGMLFECAPWAQRNLLSAADGYLGFLAIGLFATTAVRLVDRARRYSSLVSPGLR